MRHPKIWKGKVLLAPTFSFYRPGRANPRRKLTKADIIGAGVVPFTEERRVNNPAASTVAAITRAATPHQGFYRWGRMIFFVSGESWLSSSRFNSIPCTSRCFSLHQLISSNGAFHPFRQTFCRLASTALAHYWSAFLLLKLSGRNNIACLLAFVQTPKVE